MSPPILLVFSDRPWSGAASRLQHLLSRLAGRWRVVVVEPPVAGTDVDVRLAPRGAAHRFAVVEPRLPPGGGAGWGAVADPAALADRLRRVLGDGMRRPFVASVADPMAWPVARAVGAAVVVQASGFDPALALAPSIDWERRHAALLRHASLVLTDGPTRQRALRARTQAPVHCLPASVDAAHFDPRRLDATSPAARAVRARLGEHGGGGFPRLLCSSTVDARLDTPLLAMLADRWPHGSVWVAGAVRVDPASLPRRPSLHWLGQQPYDRMPHLLAACDLTLIPYASGWATRFASPSITLESFAAERPVVATAVPDVELLYGHAVRIARSRSAFVDACAEVLDEGPLARSRRVAEMVTTVTMHDWDRAASTVHGLLREALDAVGSHQGRLVLAGVDRARRERGQQLVHAGR